ncbi:MAG: citrate synthase family protein [Acidobacteria bacterium]|nr:citrate synthase family protein [Acidobacteriota bacterium]
MKETLYLTAKEAAIELEVSLPTLYAYVSRGLIRSESGDNPRLRRYRKEDILLLKQRKLLRQNPAKAAEAALDWGTPVLASEISLISEGNLYYRGQNVVDLANNLSFEEVASLIWLKDSSLAFAPARGNLYSEPLAKIHRELSGLPFVESFQALVPIAASFDPAAYDLRPSAVANTGAQILRLLAAIVSKGKTDKNSIAECLQQGWGIKNKIAAKLINAALILCADHELNASTFTARCVASTGANPYLVVSAGLAALQGYKHGGQSELVELFFREASSTENLRSLLINRLRRGEKIPGFGHSLYPSGDPRATLLIKLAQEFAPNSDAVKIEQEISSEVFSLTNEFPTLDAGLATLSQALNLPLGTAITLFAIGRTVGWIGHAIEEYQTNRLIRPRAKYIGIQPR